MHGLGARGLVANVRCAVRVESARVTSTLATIRDPRTSTRHNENGPVPSPFRGDTPEMRRHRFDCSSCPTGTQHNFVFEPAAKEVCRGQYHY